MTLACANLTKNQQRQDASEIFLFSFLRHREEESGIFLLNELMEDFKIHPGTSYHGASMHVPTVIDTKMAAEDSGYLNIPLRRPYFIYGTPPTAADVPDCKSPGTI